MISNLPSWADYGTHGESRFPELWENCIGAWAPCLGPTGLKLHDTSGRGAFGAFTNMTPSTDLMIRNGQYAVEFSYTSGASRPAIELTRVASVRGRHFASISMWINLKTAPSNTSGLYYESTSSDGFTKFGLFQSTANAVAVTARDTATGTPFSISASPPVGEWVHVCATYNAVTDLLELFFNGSLVASDATAKGPLHDSTAPSPIAIGAFTQASLPALQYTCSAFIDDVRLNAKAFSRSEIRTLASGRGVAYQRRLRRSYFAEQIGPTFRAAWARNSNYIISPVGAA